mmetsp:Transcript_22412/g.69862  ORF Transcript_22412/g.69862 Transcript_22412/m.69862 type:complete len:220 (-) Transcript_22412:104-763(-)
MRHTAAEQGDVLHQAPRAPQQHLARRGAPELTLLRRADGEDAEDGKKEQGAGRGLHLQHRLLLLLLLPALLRLPAVAVVQRADLVAVLPADPLRESPAGRGQQPEGDEGQHVHLACADHGACDDPRQRVPLRDQGLAAVQQLQEEADGGGKVQGGGRLPEEPEAPGHLEVKEADRLRAQGGEPTQHQHSEDQRHKGQLGPGCRERRRRAGAKRGRRPQL